MDLYLVAYHSRYLKGLRAEARGDWKALDRWALKEGQKPAHDDFTPFRLEPVRTQGRNVRHIRPAVSPQTGPAPSLRYRLVPDWLIVAVCLLLRPDRRAEGCRT